MHAPPVVGEELRARELRVMKRRATGLLVAVAAAFLALVALGAEDDPWRAAALAAAEGGMVGGLADWFAVTALFRHPLGLPIPHTAVVRARKDQFGQTLGAFVQENFLSSAVLVDRIRAAGITERVAAWLVQRENAEIVALHASGLLSGLADVVRDDDVHELLAAELERTVANLDLAPLAGRTLDLLTADGRHQQVLDALLRGLARFLHDNRHSLRDRFGQESPWWLPEAAEDRIFERLLNGVMSLLAAVNADPDHELRQVFDARVHELVDRLRHDPEMAARADELKAELLHRPELRSWLTSAWADVKAGLQGQAGDPASELRRRMADAVVTLGERLAGDPVLADRTERAVESAARLLADSFRDEVAGLVSGTIERWEGEETSRKLELLLGRDLQFIRINGTVVGALAGLAIHAAAEALG